MNEAPALLAEFVQRGSEKAFRESVARYTNLVYATAVRLTDGDTHAAQDIAQTVFVDLARKARDMSADVSLGGWLHRHTCFVAATALRGQRRREARERIAAAMNTQEDHSVANLAALAPALDEAINQLNAEDRAAIILRFFEQMDFRAIGARLGSSDDAARMRVNRAVEKLHDSLKGQGVALSAAALATALATESVKAAPAGLAAALASHALASTGVSVVQVAGLAKLKATFVAAAAAAILSVPLILQHQRLVQARAENQQLRSQAEQLSAAQAENTRLAAALQSNRGNSLTDQQMHELARLRAKVGLLRDRTNQLAHAFAAERNPVDNAEVHHGKLVLRGITMDQFAEFLSDVLKQGQAVEDNLESGASESSQPNRLSSIQVRPAILVTNQTKLTGTYDIAITPLRVVPESELVQRTTDILRNELGLDLHPVNNLISPVSISDPQTGSRLWTAPPSGRIPSITSYSLRVATSDASGLKPASADPDPFGLVQADEAERAANAQATVAADTADADDPAARNACINNLRLIDAAKQQWALEKGASPTNVPTWDDIRPYMRPSGDGSDPACPAGGSYTIGSVSNAPTCSIPGHVLQ